MRKWYPWLIVGLSVGFSMVVFNRLPGRITIHWDARGVANGWSGRTFGAFFMPLIMIVIAAILPLLPKIDPKRANYAKFRPTFDLVISAVITLLGFLHFITLGIALGWPIAIERMVPIAVGGLFILLGNVMPRSRANWWFGVRTPWTLSNDRVWERTHRLAGYLFVAAGIVVMLLAAVPPRIVAPLLIATVVVASVIPLVYSYFAWKQETSL